MHFEPTGFANLVVVKQERHQDERGYFSRTFCADEFGARGLISHFPQSNLAYNQTRGTVRGMHYQRVPHAETKLVRCARGAILDVVVDLRPDQPTYLRWEGFELTAGNGAALYIPAGFAHGYQTLADETEVAYAITPAFVPGFGCGLRFDDPAIDVRWPLPVTIISDKDRTWPLVAEEAR
jgi:dTDP-4-dehydrorhamnose 3,5-epimerase